MLFAAVVLFALSTVTRNVLASYAGSVLLYVLYFTASALTNSPIMASSVSGSNEQSSLAALLDPFALSAFFEQTRHWTPALRNTRLIALSGNFLLNRLLWIAASIAVLGIVYRLFAFRVVSKSRKPLHVDIAASTSPFTPYIPVATQPSAWAAYLAATKLEIRTFLWTLPFLAMILLWVGLATIELINDVNGGEYGAASYPASGMLFATLFTPLKMLATILLIYTSAEIVWRERSLRISGILNALPVSNAVFVASKCTALTALVLTLTTTGLGTAALLQLAKGWTPDVVLLLSFTYFMAAPLVLFACAAIFIQTISPHKYFGMLLVVLLAVLSLGGGAFGIDQLLLRFGSTPPISYSDMNGFGHTARFHWFILYWSALAGVLILFATALWRHGSDGLRRFLPILRASPRLARVLATILIAVFLASGAFIFYNTNVLNASESQSDILDWQAAYEKSYKAYATLPQPHITEVRATVDLYPNERRYRVRGEYVLVNDTTSSIDRILIAVRRDAASATLTMPSSRRTHDPHFNQHLFQLDSPLPPRGQTTLRFDITYAPQGFETGERDQTIVGNGSFLMTHRSFPTIGYRAGYEIEDARERRRRGLPAASAALASNEVLQRDEAANADWVRFDVTVSTSGDQRVVAPGRIVREWEHEGRRSFHFRPDAPIPNQFIISSARYAIKRETHHGVAIEIYHHPTHAYNVARMMRASAESLQVFGERFGPYPHATLRLVEVPSDVIDFGGFAGPGVIFFGENRAFLIDARDPRRLDLVYRRVAHEVAHQWWGYNLVPTNAPGATVLSESLTKYSELLALEKAYGREQVRQLLTFELDLYLSGRTSETGTEPPLTRVDNQAYLYYRKGALVMYALKDLLGETTVNRALRNLLHEQGGPRHQPAVADLLRHLHAVADPAQRILIDQWMNDVVLYDLQLDSAQSRRLANGKYEVTMRITAKKDSRDQPIPMREWIDIGLFSDDEKPLYLAKHLLHEGTQEVVVMIDQPPMNAVVDPYVCRIDRNRFDNGKSVVTR